MTNPAEGQIVVVLNNIRSNENVGSIFRTCDAAGVKKIFLCGYTPAPIDRFGRQNKALTKASLGAEKSVEWQKVESMEEVVSVLKNYHSSDNFSEFKIIGVEQDKRSINYKLIYNLPDGEAGDYNLAFVFGNEVDGLSKEDLALCDVVAEIPMRGEKESLNVAVAVGIVLFSL